MPKALSVARAGDILRHEAAGTEAGPTRGANVSAPSPITRPASGAEGVGRPKISKIREAVIRIAGNSQDGIQLVGDFLARYTGRNRMQVITFQTFPATIAGGPSIFQLRIGCGQVRSAGDEADMLVAFYQHSYEAHIRHLRKGGILLYDKDQVKPDLSNPSYRFVEVPITSMTVEAIGGSARQKGKNMFLMGLLARMFDFDFDMLLQQMKDKFLSKGQEVFETAANAFQAGYGHDLSSLTETFSLEPGESKALSQVTMNGNQAIAYGLIAAGVRFGAGYPITPWSSIMEILRAELPKYGGIFVQAEDELGAAGMAVGGSYADRIAVTGTSGPGLSLKSETIGYAVAAEIGMVVIDVQRGGPSTGLPTKVEQSDLMLACYGSHGDSPRIVLAPANVEDAFYLAIEAVDLARQYNVPVILLTDQAIATRIESFPEPDLGAVVREISPDLTAKPPSYKAYEDTPTGVSERAYPGTFMASGQYPVMTGLEHDETGHPGGDPDNHMRMNAKRRRKLQTLMQRLPQPSVYGDDSGEVLLVGWGSTKGPIEEAVDQLRSERMPVGAIHLRYLCPTPNGLEALFARFRHVFVVELNDEGIYGYGQLAMLLRGRTADPKIRSITKTDGLPFKVREIIGQMKSHLIDAGGNVPELRAAVQ
jgi:2-oxoglutarate ferredoxin oxidoreductase subunit alpha